jgi:hypothetical protein
MIVLCLTVKDVSARFAFEPFVSALKKIRNLIIFKSILAF